MASIKTNNRTRSLFYACEVPYTQKEAFRKEFDWMNDEEFHYAMFFKYRGSFYALAEFLRTEGDLLAKGWQGVLNETAFSALVVKIRDSQQSVVVGRYIC